MHWKPLPADLSTYWSLSDEEATRKHDDFEPELQSLNHINKYFDNLPNLLQNKKLATPSTEHEEASTSQQSLAQSPHKLPYKKVCRLLWPSTREVAEDGNDLDLKIQHLVNETRKIDQDFDQKLERLIEEIWQDHNDDPEVNSQSQPHIEEAAQIETDRQSPASTKETKNNN